MWWGGWGRGKGGGDEGVGGGEGGGGEGAVDVWEVGLVGYFTGNGNGRAEIQGRES